MLTTKRARLSEALCEISMLMYIVWLTLPALQTLGRSYFGVFTIGLFGLGVIIDTDRLKEDRLTLIARAAAVVALTLITRVFMKRGGEDEPLAYIVQNGMFWFPLVWSAVMITRGHTGRFKQLIIVYAACVLITTVTTLIGNWDAPTTRRLTGLMFTEEESRQVMLRGVGAYDFIYTLSLMLPMLLWYAIKQKGLKRWLTAVFMLLALVTLVKCMFLYSLLFAALAIVVELMSALIRLISRKAFKKTMSVGVSMLWTLPVFAIVFLLRGPILELGISIAQSLNLPYIQNNLMRLHRFFFDELIQTDDRFFLYKSAIDSILSSPLLGGLTGKAVLSGHSDILDLLASSGLIGALLVWAMCYALGRGNMKGLSRSPYLPHVVLTFVLLACLMLANTIVYSRDISLYLCLMLCYVAAERESGGRKGNVGG